jgi:hypothetical protein
MMIKLKNEEEQKAPGQNGMDRWMDGGENWHGGNG